MLQQNIDSPCKQQKTWGQ